MIWQIKAIARISIQKINLNSNESTSITIFVGYHKTLRIGESKIGGASSKIKYWGNFL